jgi:hypothetical protein
LAIRPSDGIIAKLTTPASNAGEDAYSGKPDALGSEEPNLSDDSPLGRIERRQG